MAEPGFGEIEYDRNINTPSKSEGERFETSQPAEVASYSWDGEISLAIQEDAEKDKTRKYPSDATFFRGIERVNRFLLRRQK